VAPAAAQPGVVASAPAAASAPVPATVPATPVPSAVSAQPHIALLLPLKSPSLQQAAEAVQQGFLAANKVQPGALPIRIYAVADEGKDVAAMYQEAVANGARAVVGPLTPAGVVALAAHTTIAVPTLALNRAEVKPADKLYSFGLPLLEGEARQVARLAASNDAHGAVIITTDTPLSRRLAQAFSDEWKKLGGDIAGTKIFTGDTGIFTDLPAEPGYMVFVAANAEKARMFRPFINTVLPVYATSQIFGGNANTLINYDLYDVVFVDMPWLLEPDHAVVARYPRANPPLEIDMERLYAIGIDAYRLVRVVIESRQPAKLSLDGVTGKIRLGANHVFEREAVMAEFNQGMGLTPAEQAALKAARRAGAASAPVAVEPADVQ